jgi:hypothetical protein
MTAPRSDDEAIFHAARNIAEPAQRRAYVRQACADDETLMAYIDALLAADERSDRLLDGSPFGPAVGDNMPTGAELPDIDLPLDFLAPSDQRGSLGRLRHYEVQEIVGRGGMGIVLRAFDEALHRVVAIKVMAPQLATSATARKRFAREARAAAAVTHDHVVTIHAVEDGDPLPCIVMQYIAGASLQNRLDQTGPLPLHEILRIAMQTACGLSAAHAQGLVHRDVKPANILLEDGVERVKLTDFGLARAVDDASLTQSGTVAGTPAFMSPEQADGQPVDPRSDLFSLGSVIYAMCTGRPPFRAGTSMGILKRVCEDTPTPVREINPDVPDWLAAVVEKLHAKDREARFQSATEVAELLGQHLAHVQNPSVVPPPTIVKSMEPPPTPEQSAGRGRRWAAAAAVLGAVLAALGTTEATGVTKIRGTIVRILTPDGTLVVETDDPEVKVTVEGDGGLVVTGAGLQEIRLKPGSYHVLADRDGKRVPLERELVTVSRGGREIVHVKLEPAPTAPAASVEKGAFVLLAAGTERRFDTLDEVVLNANHGDTIEVRGNGPFVSDEVFIRNPLVIRAGKGYTPSFTLSPAAAAKNIPLLKPAASLVLEGLELRRMGGARAKIEERYPKLLDAWHEGELHLANCRLILDLKLPQIRGSAGVLLGTKVAVLTMRNCELNGNGAATCQWHRATGGRYRIENCVSAVGGIAFGQVDPNLKDVSIRVSGNTIVGYGLTFTLWTNPKLPEKVQAAPPIRMEFSRNVLHMHPSTGKAFRDRRVLYFHQYQLKPPFSAMEAETILPRLIGLAEKHNVYSSDSPMLSLASDWKPLKGTRGQDLADWNLFWKQKDSGSIAGEIRFQGGNLILRAATAPEKLTAQDFRLRPDSAGYKAGKGGKDLGADVDLVGPGPAYERWKKTPEYQQWLKETGQRKK